MNIFVDNGKVNWDKVSILRVTDYKSKAKNPTDKNRVREITTYIPIISESYKFMANGECVLLESWIDQECGYQEFLHRWHLLSINEVAMINGVIKTGGAVVDYRVQDKYNIRKIYDKKIHHRMKMFV